MSTPEVAMTLAERRARALARLASRPQPGQRPGWPPETQPSGPIPTDIDAAEAYLAARDAQWLTQFDREIGR